MFSELAETVRWPQWSRQPVPKPQSSDIKRAVAQMSCGPRYDACDGARRAETAIGLRAPTCTYLRDMTVHIRVDTPMMAMTVTVSRRPVSYRSICHCQYVATFRCTLKNLTTLWSGGNTLLGCTQYFMYPSALSPGFSIILDPEV